MEAGADDVQPAKGEEDAVEGFKVLCAIICPCPQACDPFLGRLQSTLTSKVRLMLAVTQCVAAIWDSPPEHV